VAEGQLEALESEPGVLDRGFGVLERERELGCVAEALDGAARGSGQLLVVEGPAGIGKTTLLSIAHERARARGMRVLSARAGELERELSYAVARQLLGRTLRTARGERRERLLDGAAAAAALLEAGPAGDGSGQGAAETAGDARQISQSEYATLHGLWWLIANLADEGPLLVTVDDVHWADPASLGFLGFLARRVDELPVLLLLAARTDGWDAAQMPAGSGGRPLLPAPLSREACARLVAARLVDGDRADAAFLDACHGATGGNPFFLNALLDELARDRVAPSADAAITVLGLGPRAVRGAIVSRLGRLPAAARTLAAAVAVLGEASGELAAALGELDAAQANSAAATLGEVAIFARGEPGEPLRFAHPIIRNAVYQDLGAAERARRHARAADLLDDRYAPLEQVAAHLLHTQPGGGERVVDRLRGAAREALKGGAAGSAVAYLRRALAEPLGDSERATLLTELGLAELRIDGQSSVAHLREALALSTGRDRREAVAVILAGALLSAGEPREAAASALAALDATPDGVGDARRRLQATVLLAAGQDISLSHARERARLQLAGVDDERELGARFAQVTLALDDARRLLASARDVADRVERALEDGQLATAYGLPRFGALTVLAHADQDSAVPWLERGLESAAALGDILKLASLRLTGCLVHAVRGELQDAIADGEHGLELSRTWGIDFGLEWGSAYLAAAQIERGELAAAARTLAGPAPPDADLRHHANALVLLVSRARLHLARASFDAGLADALQLGRLAGALGWQNPAYVPWRSLAAVCLAGRGERRGRALALACEEVALARRWGAPRALGAALQAQAIVQGDHGAEACLREALAVLEGSPAKLEHARAAVALGGFLRRRGRRKEARDPLRAGLELARACGAIPLAERAYHELRATGASPRKLIRTGTDALTASERRVAGLAANGMSNKQIAQQLFVTVKTVESHLAQAYRKLEVSSRAELATKLTASPGP
jgi:DNA-binding CsgD family transcriptional regulator